MTGPGPAAGNGGGGALNGGSARPPGQSTILATDLGGDLPCLRCKYNLKGLSIRSVCPECAMPVKATLLAMVDPMAGELRPISHPLATATGVMAWSIGALAAAVSIWTMWTLQWLSGNDPLAHTVVGVLGFAVVALTLVSGLGAIALVRPHDGIRVSNRWRALVAVLAYLPLILVMWWLHVDMGPYGFSFDLSRDSAIIGTRGELRLMADTLMVVIIVCMRPNARLLAARSLLMRTGRVDRQTMLTLVAVLGISIVGDGATLVSRWLSGPEGQVLGLVGLVIVLVASVLFTLGLVGVVADCWRIRAVVIDSPVTLGGILGDPSPGPQDMQAQIAPPPT